MSNKFIAYIRVSTQKQNTNGVSLDEQRRAITEYATRHHLHIIQWFQEVTTAAKRGRPVFRAVMLDLAAGQGRLGLIMHKIDRGARNLRDWADIGEAIDLGITVRFAHDDIDLKTRGGRLTADIQAVIAADYIRNLREEVKKGIAGRLHQGLYPFRAPLGYRNMGSGKVKTPDPGTAPLIITTFRRYASGTYTYTTLATELSCLGLTQASGKPLNTSSIGKILHNPFYIGECLVRGNAYPGIHQPLITKDLFLAVQSVSKQRTRISRRRHSFRYHRALLCQSCQHFLTGESQKGRVYYRCHYCSGISVREDRIPEQLSTQSKKFTLNANMSFDLIPYEKFDYA